jgi:hypothetical protein
LFAPHLTGCGRELKIALIAAAIEGINAIWEACPTAEIVNVDPICRTFCDLMVPEFARRCEEFNTRTVFEAWDMLSGRLLPELGGSTRHLGIIGVNYYWTNQWELGCPDRPILDEDPRRYSLAELLRTVSERYGTDILITETSHVGKQRLDWLLELSRQVKLIMNWQIPLKGVCWYPILEMPEWHEDRWTEWVCGISITTRHR